MKDILKKLAVAGLTFGGLEYAKYRIQGGRPLLERVREARLFIESLLNDEREGPITLKAGEYKIV